MDNALVTIQPRELRFPFILNNQTTTPLHLKNNTESHVAFKIKTTAPMKYSLRPNPEIINPKATFELNIIMQAPSETPPNYQCKDKFLVRTAKVPEGITAKDITEEVFKKGPGKIVEDSILTVVYTPPPQTPVIPKSAEGASPAPVSTLDNVSQDAFASDQGPEDPTIKAKYEELPIDVIGLKEKLDQVAKEHEKLKTEYDQKRHLQTEVDDLKGNFGQLQTDVDDLKEKLGRIQTDAEESKAKFGEVVLAIRKLTEEQSSALRRWERQTRDELELLQKIRQSKEKGRFQLLLVCWTVLIGIIVGCFLRSKLSSS